jgi:hypothetical protein
MKLVCISFDITSRNGEAQHHEIHINLSGVRREKVGQVCRAFIESYSQAQGWRLAMATACIERPMVIGSDGKMRLIGRSHAPSAYFDGEGWDIQ